MPPHCNTTIIGSQLYHDIHISIVDACRCFGTFIHAVTEFHSSIVTVLSAESVGGSTPGVRVTWNTTVPPDCVTSVRVEFRTSKLGPVVANYTTTNTSQTEILIQTGLQCSTNYYIRVVVTGGPGGTLMLSPRPNNIVQVLAGGKATGCM